MGPTHLLVEAVSQLTHKHIQAAFTVPRKRFHCPLPREEQPDHRVRELLSTWKAYPEAVGGGRGSPQSVTVVSVATIREMPCRDIGSVPKPPASCAQLLDRRRAHKLDLQTSLCDNTDRMPALQLEI